MVLGARVALCVRVGSGRERPGSTIMRSPATRSPGTSRPRLPARPSVVTSAVIKGGPMATPIFPPVEKIDTPVALRSPATCVAVRYPSG